MNLLIRLVVKALAFMFLLPIIPGIHLHAGFLTAVVLAIFFSLTQWLVEIGAAALTAWLTISTLGLALLILIPMWILGFWLLPAVALKMVADLMPQYLSVGGWEPAILGGLLLFVVGMVTTDFTSTQRTATV